MIVIESSIKNGSSIVLMSIRTNGTKVTTSLPHVMLVPELILTEQRSILL